MKKLNRIARKGDTAASAAQSKGVSSKIAKAQRKPAVPKPAAPKEVPGVIELPSALVDLLERAAAQLGVSRSQLLKTAIEEAIARESETRPHEAAASSGSADTPADVAFGDPKGVADGYSQEKGELVYFGPDDEDIYQDGAGFYLVTRRIQKEPLRQRLTRAQALSWFVESEIVPAEFREDLRIAAGLARHSEEVVAANSRKDVVFSDGNAHLLEDEAGFWQLCGMGDGKLMVKVSRAEALGWFLESRIPEQLRAHFAPAVTLAQHLPFARQPAAELLGEELLTQVERLEGRFGVPAAKQVAAAVKSWLGYVAHQDARRAAGLPSDSESFLRNFAGCLDPDDVTATIDREQSKVTSQDARELVKRLVREAQESIAREDLTEAYAVADLLGEVPCFATEARTLRAIFQAYSDLDFVGRHKAAPARGAAAAAADLQADRAAA